MREPLFTETLQVALVVRDLDAAMRTYFDEYGIGPWSVYEFDPGNVKDMGLPAKTSPIDHVAFEAEGYDELLGRLAAAGVDVTANAVPGGVRQLFFDDPNGARIELVVSG